MFDFETVMMKHSEGLIQQIVDTWERYNGVRQESPMMLEERWERFIRATNDNLSRMPASVAACR